MYGELRNVFDLALITMLIKSEDLHTRVQWDLDYFLDENGNPFFEEKYSPISIYSSGYRVLKPNYTYRFDKNEYHTIDNLGDEWSGKIKIEIVDIEFAE